MLSGLRTARFAVWLAPLAWLPVVSHTGCGRFSGSSLWPYNALGILSVGGQVNGLVGSGLSLRLNSAGVQAVGANGTFTFSNRVPMGLPYTVSVVTQPTTPTQTCSVAGAQGVALAEVRDVVITCATPNTTLADGPVITNPFGDGIPAGMIFVHNSKLYIGPNAAENAVFEMAPDLSSLQTVTIDGDGTPGAPFTSFIGLANSSGTALAGIDTFYSGCTVAGSSGLSGSACTGAGGTEYNFIGGFLTGGGLYRSVWTTTNTSSPLTYNERSQFEHSNNTFRSGAMRLFKQQLYVANQHIGTVGPRFGRMCVNPAGCANGDALWAITALNGSGLAYIGKSGTPPNGRSAAGQLVSIDTMWEYDNDGVGTNPSQLYIASGGSTNGVALPSTGGASRDGGIVRTALGSSTAAATPADSSATHWQNVTPTNLKWTSYMSIAMPENPNAGSDWTSLLPSNRITPAIKAIPAMRTAPNGDLYLIRNACSSITIHRVAAGNFVSNGRQTCPQGSEIPQIWLLPQGTTATPKGTADWILVAETGATGRSDMSARPACTLAVNQCDTENTHVSLLEINGTYLYVGFDNAAFGLNIWRTNLAAVASGSAPTASSFELVGGFGLGSATVYTRLFANLSYSVGGSDFVVLLAGNGTGSMSVFRTGNL